MLCLENYAKALDDFERADLAASQEMEKMGTLSHPYLGNIGTTLWLLGRRKDAIRAFRAGAEGI